MGYIKPNSIFLSHHDVVMESGKLLKMFWKDKTVNGLLSRMGN